MKFRMSRHLLLLAVSLLVARCATVSTPTGGPRDTVGPKFLSSSIPNASTNFTGRAITLEFDEFVTIKNPSQNIISSPPLGKNASYTARKNKIFITFREDLEENTTYQINFGNSIVDVNESNPLSNFQFVFATGDYLDSLSISGSITPINGIKFEKNTLIGFYKDLRDSAFLEKPPYYFSFVGEDGQFELNYLKAGSYKVIALKDANNNYYYDLPNESIGFADSVLVLAANTPPLNIPLFLPEEATIRVKTFTTNINSYQINYELSSALTRGSAFAVAVLGDTVRQTAITQISENRLKITAWIPNALATESSLRSILELNGVVIDTFEHAVSKQKAPDFNLTVRPAKISQNDSLIIEASCPMVKGDKEFFIIDTLEQDTQRLFASYTTDFQIIAKPAPRSLTPRVYTLLIPDSTLFNIYDKTNVRFRKKIEYVSPEAFGTLYFTFENHTDSSHYLLELQSSDGKPIRKLELKPGIKSWKISALPPASYKLQIIVDANKNGVWNSGSYLPRKLPEVIYTYPKEFPIRANWDLEETINLKTR